jgi:SAD/SRA domain
MQGVQVGDYWKDRLDCRQWGAHFPHVAGIAGQSNRGAQVRLQLMTMMVLYCVCRV